MTKTKKALDEVIELDELDELAADWLTRRM